MGVVKATRSIVRKNSTGSDITRRRLNFIEGTNVTLTVGDDPTNNEIDVTIASSGGSGFTWNEETGTSATMSVDNGYISNNASAVTFTLPDTAAVGSRVVVLGKGAGGWIVAQNASEQIIVNATHATTAGVGGSLNSNDRYDAVELICTVADTTWTVTNIKGNIDFT